jgi:hypothetical protein
MQRREITPEEVEALIRESKDEEEIKQLTHQLDLMRIGTLRIFQRMSAQ